MKKIVILVFILLLSSNLLAQTLSAGMSFDKEKYFRGEKAILGIDIENHAFEDVKNVDIYINSPFGEYRDSVISIDARDKTRRTFEILLNNTGDFYFEGNIQWDEKSFEMVRKSITVEPNPLLIETDADKGVFHFAIQNKGEILIKDVNINFDISGDLQTTADTQHFIHKLIPGEKWAQDITFSSKKSGYIQVNVQYKDEDGETHEYINYLSVNGQTELPMETLQIIVLIIIAILVLKLFVFK